VFESTKSFPTAPVDLSSMEFHAHAISDSSKVLSIPVPHVLQERSGMDNNVVKNLPKPVLLATSSTPTSNNVNQLPHLAVITLSSMEPPVSVLQAITSLTTTV